MSIDISEQPLDEAPSEDQPQSDEEQYANNLDELITKAQGATDPVRACDIFLEPDAIEALAFLHCTDGEAEGIRLLARIKGLPGMAGRKTSIEKLLRLRINEIRVAMATVAHSNYTVHEERLCCVLTSAKGQTRVPIADFYAFIKERVEYVGGEERKPRFTLDVFKYNPATQSTDSRTLTMDSSEYDEMKWPTLYLPSGWDIRPGAGNRDAVRYAIRMLSAPITKERQVYQHLGWVKLQETTDEQTREQWVYLHAGGAIGAGGPLPLETDLGKTDLGRYLLPAPLTGAALIAGIGKVLQFQELAADDRPNSLGLAAVCLSLPWRAAWDSCAFSVLFVGQSGARKTTMAQLILNHFASGFTYGSRPSSPVVWTASEPILRRMLHHCKDSILLIDDDFHTQRDEQSAAKVTKVLQAQGNGRARQTMSQITHEEGQAFDPRGAIISTHEDAPTNYSSLGRALVVPLGKESGTVHLPTVTKLQRYAKEEVFTGVMAAYIQWVAGRRDQWRNRHVEQVQRFAQALARKIQGVHERTPEILAELLLGADYFLRFATEVGALTKSAAEEWRVRITEGLLSLVAHQQVQQAELDDATRFVEIVHDLLATGRAYIEDEAGTAPSGSEAACGWHQTFVAQGKKVWATDPTAILIGIVKDEVIYIYSGVAFEHAQTVARRQGNELRPASTIFNTLLDRGDIIPYREKRHKHPRALARKMLKGFVRNSLLQFPIHAWSEGGTVGQPAGGALRNGEPPLRRGEAPLRPGGAEASNASGGCPSAAG
jgi:hypothetical protein